MIHQLAIALLASSLQAGPDSPGAPAAAAADFTRYQTILDRKPFGDIAAAAAEADAAATNPNIPPLSASLRLVALEKDDDSGALRAGLVDAGGKRTYYLKVGEEDDGVTLVNADFKGDRALVRKGTQEEWLTMGAGAAKTTPTLAGPTPSGSGVENDRRQRFRDMMAARNAQAHATALAPPQPPPPDPATNRPQFKNNEEMKEYYRKINLDLIRAGGKKGPPLPMALTPEDDAQLVKEGVLPPIETAAPPQ